MHTKIFLLTSLLAAFVPPCAVEEELVLSPPADATMVIAFSMEASMDLVDQSVTVMVGGEDRSPENPSIEITVEQVVSLVMRDRVLGMEDGQVTKLRRSFEKITEEQSQEVESETGSGSNTSEGESELEGASVVFTWDPEESDYGVEFDEDEDGDEDLLEDLEFDVYLASFLPDEAVSIGDTWEVEASAMSSLVDPGGDLKSVSETSTDEDSERARQNRENMEGTVTCTLTEVVEEDGVRIAIIELNAEITTGYLLEQDLDEQGVTGTTEEDVSIEYDVTGELRWNLDSNVLISADASGDISYNLAQSADVMQGDMSIQQTVTQSFEGSRSIQMEVSIEGSED